MFKETSHYKLNPMTRDQFISLFFIALLILVVYQICLIFSPFTRAIFWSGILAFSFYPLFEKLREHLEPRRTLAAILMTVAIFLIVIPPVVLLILNLIGQAIDLYQSATTYVQHGELEKLIDQIRALHFVQRIETGLLQWEPLKNSVSAWLLNTTRSIGNFAAIQAREATKNIFIVALNVFLMTVLLFIFLRDGGTIYRFIYEIAPMEEKTKKAIFKQLNETFAAVIRGQLLTSAAQAVLSGIIFWSLGLPVPLLFAALTFLIALIPVMGASGVWLPLAIYLAATHQYVKAGILLVLGTFVISLIDNILKPILIGKKTKLPYFLLFFGILGGLRLYGLMGIFLAPVMLSLFFALTKIYQEKYL